MKPWWQHFPRASCRGREPTDADQPDVALAPGTLVRLIGKPEQIRRVLNSEWHRHRWQFAYIVETTARAPFEPYWFAEQLEIVERLTRA